MENLEELNGGLSQIIDFFKENKKGTFTTENLYGQKFESDVAVRFIYKKPLPSIEVNFENETDFYKHHRKNLYRGSLSKRRMGQLFTLEIVSRTNGRAKVLGVAQTRGNGIVVIVHLVEYIYAKSGRKFDYSFL